MRRTSSWPREGAVLALLVAPALLCASRAAGAETPPPPPSLQAGGLQAPGGDLAPPPPPPESNETSRDLERADREDSGRGLEIIYFNVEGGYPQHVGLSTLHAGSNALVPSASTIKTTDDGPMFGVGAGLRLLFLTLGPRFRVGRFSGYDIWSLNAEVGLRLPLGSVEPHFDFGAGFTKLGNANEAQASLASNSGVSIRGYDVRAGFGVDWYVTNVLSLGANVTGEAVFLTRPGVDVRTLAQGTGGVAASCSSLPTDQQAACATAQAYKADGSSIGMILTPSLVAGLHF